MKKIFTILLLYFVCISNSILITSCAEEDVTGYYSVSFYQADSANNLHKYIVKQTTSYDSDSLAVVRETQLFHKLQDMGQMEIEKAGGKDKSSNVYLRMRDEQRSIVRIIYKKNFCINQLVALLEEHGDKSDMVINYCKDNNIDYVSYPLLPKKYDYVFQGISIDCVGIRDIAIRYETSKKLNKDQIVKFVTEETDGMKDSYYFQMSGKLEYATFMYYNRKNNTINLFMHDENKVYDVSFNGSNYTLEEISND